MKLKPGKVVASDGKHFCKAEGGAVSRANTNFATFSVFFNLWILGETYEVDLTVNPKHVNRYHACVAFVFDNEEEGKIIHIIRYLSAICTYPQVCFTSVGLGGFPADLTVDLLQFVHSEHLH